MASRGDARKLASECPGEAMPSARPPASSDRPACVPCEASGGRHSRAWGGYVSREVAIGIPIPGEWPWLCVGVVVPGSDSTIAAPAGACGLRRSGGRSAPPRRRRFHDVVRRNDATQRPRRRHSSGTRAPLRPGAWEASLRVRHHAIDGMCCRALSGRVCKEQRATACATRRRECRVAWNEAASRMLWPAGRTSRRRPAQRRRSVRVRSRPARSRPVRVRWSGRSIPGRPLTRFRACSRGCPQRE